MPASFAATEVVSTSTAGCGPASVTVISPSPVRLPLAPPPSPVAVSIPRPTVTVSSVSSASDSAVSRTVAALPPAVKVTKPALVSNATPSALALSASVKSVPSVPPVKLRGTTRRSPSTSARLSATEMPAVSVARSSVAPLSESESVTAVGSSSATSTEARSAPVAGTYPFPVATRTLTEPGASSALSPDVATM